jgi:hypothetical protein
MRRILAVTAAFLMAQVALQASAYFQQQVEGKALAQSRLDDRRGKPLYYLPVGQLVLQASTPLGNADLDQGELNPEAIGYQLYLGMERAGIVKLSGQQAIAQPGSLFNNFPGRRGTLSVQLAENGSQYLCKDGDLANHNVPARAKFKWLCMPYMGASVERVVSDKQLEKGGTTYRWIMYVYSTTEQSPWAKAFYEFTKSAPNGQKPETRQVKASEVYKLDPFSNSWKIIEELSESANIDLEFKENKAENFFNGTDPTSRQLQLKNAIQGRGQRR